MAESRRKLDSKKYQPKEEEVDEAAQRRFYVKWGIILGLGAIAIIIFMFYLSHFLSGK